MPQLSENVIQAYEAERNAWWQKIGAVTMRDVGGPREEYFMRLQKKHDQRNALYAEFHKWLSVWSEEHGLRFADAQAGSIEQQIADWRWNHRSLSPSQEGVVRQGEVNA